MSGVIYGMAKSADLVSEDGVVPGAKMTFMAVSLGTLLSAITGGTPIIVYVESATGIKEGGRSGLSAVLIGLLFIICLPFAPVLASIPLTATSPVAMLIGAMMMSQAKEIDWYNMSEAIPAFLTLSVMPFTFSITDGIVFGLLSAGAFYVTTGQIFIDIRAAFSRREVLPTTEPVTEMTHLKGSAGPSRASTSISATPDHSSKMRPLDHSDRANSFLDNDPKSFVRAPSLILSKKTASKAKGDNLLEPSI